MNIKHYTYRVTWSPEDGEHVGLCAELPSLSWLAKTPEAALKGIQKVVADVVADMLASGESVPVALAEKNYSGQFRVRVPPLASMSATTSVATFWMPLSAASGVFASQLRDGNLAHKPTCSPSSGDQVTR